MKQHTVFFLTTYEPLIKVTLCPHNFFNICPPPPLLLIYFNDCFISFFIFFYDEQFFYTSVFVLQTIFSQWSGTMDSQHAQG